MNLNIPRAVILAAFMALSAVADEHPHPELAPPAQPAGPVDPEKVSYALGMKLGIQRRDGKSDLDINTFSKGLKDGIDGKASNPKEAEIMAILKEGQARGTNQTTEQKLKVTYTAGLRTGMQLKSAGAEVNADTITQAIKDVSEGKPTKLKESELDALLKQAQDAAITKAAAGNKIAGEAFLAKNAKEPGIEVLPDGLQYRLISEGTGRLLTTNDHAFIKWRGTFLDGKEFDHHNRFPIDVNACFPSWSDALQRMKTGGKCRVYSPPALAFGHEGEPHYNVPPDTTVIFELEVREIVRADDPRLDQGVLGHGTMGRDDP